MLVCSPATCNHAVVFSEIRSVLMTLMATQAGLLYLSSRVETVNGILRVLMQNSVSVSIDCEISIAAVVFCYVLVKLRDYNNLLICVMARHI